MSYAVTMDISGIVVVLSDYESEFVRSAEPVTKQVYRSLVPVGDGWVQGADGGGPRNCQVFMLRVFGGDITDDVENFLTKEFRATPQDQSRRKAWGDISMQWLSQDGDCRAYRIMLDGEIHPMYCVGGTSSPRAKVLPGELDAYGGNAYDWFLDQARQQWSLRRCADRVLGWNTPFTKLSIRLPDDVPADD